MNITYPIEDDLVEYRPGAVYLIDDDDDDDGHPIIALNIQINSKTIIFHINPSLNFDNSPRRKSDFDRFVALLRTQHRQVSPSNHTYTHTDPETAKIFQWTVPPCVSLLRDLAPPSPEHTTSNPAEPLTIQHIYHRDRYTVELLALNDHLLPSRPTRLPSHPDDDPEFSSYKTAFPVLHPSEVEISPDEVDQKDMSKPPRVVRARGREFDFRESNPLDWDGDMKLMGVYTRVLSSEPGVTPGDSHGGSGSKETIKARIRRVEGLVVDEGNFLVGVLMERVPGGGVSLVSVLPRDGVDASAAQGGKLSLKMYGDVWMQQVRDSLAVLHGKGVVWGDVSLENIWIDGEGNAWIAELGIRAGGEGERWVGWDKRGTMGGDLQGLERIEEFVRVVVAGRMATVKL